MYNTEPHYYPIYRHQFGLRKVFKLMHDPLAPWPWAIEYNGNRHCGFTVREILHYANGRGWITSDKIEVIAGEIAGIFDHECPEIDCIDGDLDF